MNIVVRVVTLMLFFSVRVLLRVRNRNTKVRDGWLKLLRWLVSFGVVGRVVLLVNLVRLCCVPLLLLMLFRVALLAMLLLKMKGWLNRSPCTQKIEKLVG